MNDHDALLHAIGEHPEEDTPRLMFADWLEENGQPERADFVRNQIELTRRELTAAERHQLVKKNVYYLTNWVPHWKAQLPRIDGIEWGDFNRGLIEEVQAADDRSVIQHADAIFRVPGIHVLRLRRLRRAQALAEVPQLARLRALKMVSAGAHEDGLGILLASPHLGQLVVLDLHGNRIDNVVSVNIAGGWFQNLTELWLGSNRVGNRGARALASSPYMTQLRLLDLQDNPIDHAACSTLRSRFWSKVKL
ncbi:Leucine Rich repeats (2 copies) [Gemmata sp. SH-PL17]|uniref:TIGR02996 domain-containing protein n=1 Tax=Gemmata sp. SH-PL17 TaxID=1630693 RepID=UPI00078E0836|nr:TIGR02996 domain-containing protein [Gemmata sp. SH-PL17]AMV28162.1 Leucine Rich repeats (2 copies) [Gemmata sp. SH-PL17]